MNHLSHAFDLEARSEMTLDLFAEELPEQIQLTSDCLSSASSLSCCGTSASFSSVGSVASTGADQPQSAS